MYDKEKFKSVCAEIIFAGLVPDSGQTADEIMMAIHHIAECPMCNNMAREIVEDAKAWPIITERRA